MNGFVIRKAERIKRKARVGLLGPTGSGKTMAALLIAKGIGGSTCLIDTENHSGDLYAGHPLLGDWSYDVLTLEKPFSVERYMGAITAAEEAHYANIIIDSASHAWAGPGGILEFVDKKTEQQNKFVGWRDATPKHNEFVQRLTSSPANIIVTMRVKMDYVLEENDKGKKVPKKVGLQPIQRDGLEYEFDVVFDITQAHLASSTKDRTSLFDGEMEKITSQTGERLRAWLETGIDAPAAVPPSAAPAEPQSEPVTEDVIEKKVAEWCAKIEAAATLDALKEVYGSATSEMDGLVTELQAEAIMKAKNKRARELVAAKKPANGAAEKAAA